MTQIQDILPGRIAYKNLVHAKPEGFAPFREGEGVKHLGRKYIKYDQVDYGITEDNPVRLKVLGNDCYRNSRFSQTRN